MKLSALLVDDHDGFRTELRALLQADGVEVVAEAATGADAIAKTARFRPNVVLLDVGLPDASGLDLIETIRALSPEAMVVLISGRRESEYGGLVARSGADGFLEKSHLMPGVVQALLTHPETR